jgi:hypothetical protein
MCGFDSWTNIIVIGATFESILIGFQTLAWFPLTIRDMWFLKISNVISSKVIRPKNLTQQKYFGLTSKLEDGMFSHSLAFHYGSIEFVYPTTMVKQFVTI